MCFSMKWLVLAGSAVLLGACSHASSSAGDAEVPARDAASRQYLRQAVLRDSVLVKSATGGLFVRLSQSADADPASPTSVHLMSVVMKHTDVKTMTMTRLVRAARDESSLGSFQGTPKAAEHLQQTYEVYGAGFYVAPGLYRGTIERPGFQSESSDAYLRSGFIDTLVVTLTSKPHP